jgi:hypothetical protein
MICGILYLKRCCLPAGRELLVLKNSASVSRFYEIFFKII